MKIGLSLNQIQNFTPSIWTMGKIYTYAKQKEPFIHVDGDVIIGEPLPFKEEALIAQHFEKDFPHNQKFLSLLIKKKYKFTPYLDLTSPNYVVKEINAGILGGSNISFFQEYTEYIFNFLKENSDKIYSLYSKQEITAVNTIIEQCFFYNLASKLNIHISTLFPDNYVSDCYKQLVSFRHMKGNNYIHPVGYYKSNPYIGERISETLMTEFPTYFNRYLYYKNDILSLINKVDNKNVAFKFEGGRYAQKVRDNELLIQNIRKYVLLSRIVEKNDYLKINPYAWTEKANQEVYLIRPSILSTPEDVKHIKIRLGVIGDFFNSLISNFGNEIISVNKIIKEFNDLSAQKKIMAAIQQLVNIRALVLLEADAEKPATSKLTI
jgi:hypothetical protein